MKWGRRFRLPTGKQVSPITITKPPVNDPVASVLAVDLGARRLAALDASQAVLEPLGPKKFQKYFKKSTLPI